jgi:hypothetical protein
MMRRTINSWKTCGSVRKSFNGIKKQFNFKIFRATLHKCDCNGRRISCCETFLENKPLLSPKKKYEKIILDQTPAKRGRPRKKPPDVFNANKKNLS